jgi:cytochrome oxidase assembly protein ShyY1
VVAVVAAVLLGSWQYDAWQERRAAEARDLTNAEPVPLNEAIGPDDPFPGDMVGQPVTIEGSWVPEGTVLVSGREHDGQDGYWVLTPVAVDGADGANEADGAHEADAPAIPVVRGWTPSRADVPPPPTGATELVGWLQPPEGTGETDTDPTDDVLPQVRTADLVQRVDQDLYGAYAVVTDDPGTNDGTDGLAPATLEQLPDVGRFTAVRNLLYAVEWWFFGAFAVFIWWRWLRDEQAAEETQATPEPQPRGEPASTTGEGQ